MTPKEFISKQRGRARSWTTAAVLIGLATLGSGISQYAIVTTTGWQPAFELTYDPSMFQISSFVDTFNNLSEAQNSPYYTPEASPFSKPELESLQGVLIERIGEVSPPYVFTVGTKKGVFLNEPSIQLPKVTYTNVFNGLEMLVQHSEAEPGREFSNLVYVSSTNIIDFERGFFLPSYNADLAYNEPYRSPAPTPTLMPGESESQEIYPFDFEIRLSVFTPDYFKSLIGEPAEVSSLITELLKHTDHKDVEPYDLDSIIAFWKQVCDEMVKALNVPKELGEAIAEFVVQRPLESGLGFLIFLIRRLRKRLLEAGQKAEEARVSGCDEDLLAVQKCLEIAKMKLAGLVECTGMPKETLDPFLKYLKKKKFIFQNPRTRFYSLTAS